MPYIAYIGLGSNVGDTANNIAQAVQSLEDAGLVTERLSSLYATAPVGEGLTGMFHNAVIRMWTDLTAEKLLDLLLLTEKSLGRDRSKGRDRIIDLDVLLMQDLATGTWIRCEHPIVPHPRMWLREFVIAPLGEVLPAWQQVRQQFESKP